MQRWWRNSYAWVHWSWEGGYGGQPLCHLVMGEWRRVGPAVRLTFLSFSFHCLKCMFKMYIIYICFLFPLKNYSNNLSSQRIYYFNMKKSQFILNICDLYIRSGKTCLIARDLLLHSWNLVMAWYCPSPHYVLLPSAWAVWVKYSSFWKIIMSRITKGIEK